MTMFGFLTSSSETKTLSEVTLTHDLHNKYTVRRAKQNSKEIIRANYSLHFESRIQSLCIYEIKFV